jgi:GH15 family glucan-1,4-alpha-glucosidase
MFLFKNTYGIIGDGQSAALVTPEGAIDWCCLPDFTSPAIFCRQDNPQGGYFQIRPAENPVAGTQRYLQGSNILQTIFTVNASKVVLTDFMPVMTLHATTEQEKPALFHQCLVRSVECVDGELMLNMQLKVTPYQATVPSEVQLLSATRGAVISGGEQYVGMAILGTERIAPFTLEILPQEEGELNATLNANIMLREGERLQFVLGLGSNALSAQHLVEVELPERNFDWELAHTLHSWRKWIANNAAPGIHYGPYQDWAQRSALMLKLLEANKEGKS